MKKVTAQRVIDTDRGVANGGQVYASVAALGPAVAISPPPTGLAVTANTIQLSAQTPMALISLLWYPPQAQTVRGYQLQVATDSGFTTNVEYFSTGSDTTTSLELITSAAGITYYIRVRVFAGNLISEWSSSVSVLAAADTTPAGIPTSLAYTWDGADLLITWVNPSSTNLRDVEVRIWNSSGKTVLYHTGFSASQRYTWTLPQQRIDTSGSLDAAVYVELRSRTWSQVFGTSTAGISPTNSAPSAPASVALISSIGTLTISVTATAPTDFAAYRYRIVQTLPSAADVTFDSPSPLENYSLYAQATYQVGVKVLDVYGQLSSETLSSASIIDTLTIGSLRAEIIYSDSDSRSDATLHIPLSDALLNSGTSFTYATTATWNKWVRGERTLLDRYRVITLSLDPSSGTTSWYLRVSSDASTWTYYAGPVTSSRILTLVASAAAAQAAAISTTTLGGTATSKVELPATIEARFVEVWFRNPSSANSYLYEFYPRRLIEADDIYVQNLSSISANIGTITAGTINSVTINTSTINAGGGDIVLSGAGLSITRDTTTIVGAQPILPSYVPGATRSLRFVNSATLHGYIGQTATSYTSPAVTLNEFLIGVPAVTSQESYITLFADHTARSSVVRLLAQSGSGTPELAYLEVLANTGGGNSYVRANAETVYLDGVVSLSNYLQADYSTNGSGSHHIRNTNTGSSAYGALYVGNNTDVTSGILRNSSANTGYAGANSLSLFHVGAYPIGFVTSNVLRMTIGSGGEVAIGRAPVAGVRMIVQGGGTSSATYGFNVKNSAGTDILSTRDDGLSNIISSAWSSDERHKTELRAIDESDLVRFRALEPLHYIRTNGPGGSEYGLSAQRTRLIFPEVVSVGPDDYLSLRYNDMIPLLMAEVQSLRKRVQAIEGIAV